ncbi:MAG: DUF3240 family protein [Betaproteobacteria bacterium]|nr:DUF3240 family protein [Betaproteobacteria bacterium]MCL2886062.1 DUF3240 family protein [Betaproteobacteria bacterium]
MNENPTANASPEYDCEMTLAFPRDLEEQVVDFLLDHPQWIRGFSLIDAEGMGRGAGLRSAMEKVKGRARRRLMNILLRNEDIAPLVAALRQEFHTPEMAYWVIPLHSFGRMV